MHRDEHLVEEGGSESGRTETRSGVVKLKDRGEREDGITLERGQVAFSNGQQRSLSRKLVPERIKQSVL